MFLGLISCGNLILVPAYLNLITRMMSTHIERGRSRSSAGVACRRARAGRGVNHRDQKLAVFLTAGTYMCQYAPPPFWAGDRDSQ